jgi:hypothetical protein
MHRPRSLIALLAFTLSSVSVAQDPPPPPQQPAPPSQPGSPPRKDDDAPPAPPRGEREGREGREGPQGRSPGEGRPRGPRGGQGGGQPMNVEAAMKGLNRALTAMGEAVADPSRKGDALRLVAEAQRNCATAKMLPLPSQFTRDAADEAAKAKIVDEYASDLRKTMRMLLELEDAVAAGKADEARAILARIEEMRKHAHEELGVKD